MTSKFKFLTRVLILTIIISIIITLRIITIPVKKNVLQKDTKGVFMVGFSEGERAGLVKELEKASRQFAYIEKGNSLIKENKIDEAIKAYETAYTLAKSSGGRGEAIYYLANAYEKKGDYKKALEYAILDRDKFVSDWAKEPVVERAKYLEYALLGEYELAIEHAQKALETDANLPNTPKGGSPDYIERLNDLKAAKDYILSLKKNR